MNNISEQINLHSIYHMLLWIVALPIVPREKVEFHQMHTRDVPLFMRCVLLFVIVEGGFLFCCWQIFIVAVEIDFV